VSERDRRAVTQAGVPVLEVGALLVAGEERQLGRGVRIPENPPRVAPQHAAQQPRSVIDGADEGREVALGRRPGVVPRSLGELPEGPPHGERLARGVRVGRTEDVADKRPVGRGHG